jgi:TolB protein
MNFLPFRAFLCALIWLLAASAHAQLKIEITGAGANQTPVAILPFKAETTLPQAVTPVVAADLGRSGLFKLIDTGGLAAIPGEPGEVDYDTWKARGATALVVGNVEPASNGYYYVRFRLMDVLKQAQLAGFAYQVTPQQLRGTAHKIADVIYEKLTGDVGVFSTRIAYVEKNGRRFELRVSDADGYEPQSILTSNEPIMSPAWAPDGQRIAYVSLQARKPVVYIQSIAGNRQQTLANYKGSNSAPAWSPDGRRLAVVLTKDGNSQIYLINPDGSNLTRLTHSNAIDTEPNFSPDGQSIIFTSDRGGSPQIYRMSVNGGTPERLTFEGSYNVSPRYAPDGKSFVFIQRSGGRFNVAVQDFTSRQVQLLTDDRLNESPSFAPNSRLILYASAVSGRGILSAVSSDGQVRQRFTIQSGDVREPAWGPIPKTQ